MAATTTTTTTTTPSLSPLPPDNPRGGSLPSRATLPSRDFEITTDENAVEVVARNVRCVELLREYGTAVSTFLAVNRLLMSPIRNTRHQHRPLPSPFSPLLPIYLPPLSSYSSPFRDIHPYNQRVNRPCRKRDYYLDNRKINCKMRRFTLPAREVMVILITYLLLPDCPQPPTQKATQEQRL